VLRSWPIFGAAEAARKESVMAVTGYCLKCKKKVEIKNPQHITMKNGKPATTGECPTCGTKIYKIGKA
jgi:DNA-directed RNA polymerase subunit RPC12/RpoP